MNYINLNLLFYCIELKIFCRKFLHPKFGYSVSRIPCTPTIHHHKHTHHFEKSSLFLKPSPFPWIWATLVCQDRSVVTVAVKICCWVWIIMANSGAGAGTFSKTIILIIQIRKCYITKNMIFNKIINPYCSVRVLIDIKIKFIWSIF